MNRTPVGLRRSALLFLLAGLIPHTATATLAQTRGGSLRVELGVEPREVTVGDPFRSVARISAPEGYTVRYFDIDEGDSIASARPLEVVQDATGRETAIFTLVAWATGELRAPVRIEVTAPDGAIRTHEVRLQLPVVRSVLPEDTAGVTPRPPKSVIEPPRGGAFPWWWLLLLLLLAAALWLAYHLSQRRDEAVVPLDPRDWALQQLSDEHIQAVAPPGTPTWIADHLSRVLREYMDRTYGVLSRDLTTSEVLERLGNGPAATSLGLILGPADRVKFARDDLTGTAAAALLERARDWVGRYPVPAGVPENARRAA